MTVLEVIQRSAEFLEKKGVDSPRLQIELLLAHVLNIPRLNLYLDFERRLTESELDAVRELVKRRAEREPLQYLLGTTSFCGLELAVNTSVLIPRPETELLAETSWEILAATRLERPVVLDFATGSGCLAIAIALKFPNAELHAVDISAAALGVARANAQRHNANVQFHTASRLSELQIPQSFDLIVSNPPYIPTSEIAILQPEVRDHEPVQALDGGPDGLDFYRMLAREAPPRLTPTGRVALEFGDGQAGAVSSIFEAEHWHVAAVLADYSGRPRILIAHRKD